MTTPLCCRACVPTLLQRGGNFSQTLNAAGNPVQLFNPATGLPFPGNMVPVSTQAQALLNEYPMPNLPGTGLYNYQAAVLNSSQQNSVQARWSKNKGRNQFFGTFAYQGATTDATNLFGFEDSTYTSGLDAAANWSRGYRAGTGYLVIHFKYEFSRLATDVTPFFANRSNVSGQAEHCGQRPGAGELGSAKPDLLQRRGRAFRTRIHAKRQPDAGIFLRHFVVPQAPHRSVRWGRPAAAIQHLFAAGRARDVCIHRRGHSGDVGRSSRGWHRLRSGGFHPRQFRTRPRSPLATPINIFAGGASTRLSTTIGESTRASR